jgi:hypothetical protein
MGAAQDDELTLGGLQVVVVTERRCAMAGSRLQASATTATSSGGALAPGNLTTVAVDLGEAPPVIILARQASGGLSDSGSKARVAGQFFCVDKTIVGEGVYIGENTRRDTKGLQTDSISN